MNKELNNRKVFGFTLLASGIFLLILELTNHEHNASSILIGFGLGTLIYNYFLR